MSKSCSIFFYEGYIGVAPTIISLSKSLNDCGYLVTIYASQNPYPSPDKIGNQTTVTYFDKASNIPLISKRIELIYKFKLGTLIPIIDLVFYACHCLTNLLKTKNLKGSQNDLGIGVGVDANGSILALLSYYFFQRKFIYLSLELYHPSLYRRFNKIINLLDRLAYRKSECVVVQDEDRFKTLCEYHQYQHPKVFYLPNSSSSSKSSCQDMPFQNFFRKMFNLNEDKFPYIVLQAGMIGDAVLSKELAHAFASINKGCVLIFHERLKREIDDPYIKFLQKINSINLFLSLEPVPYEEIDKVYASATIGLAFYKNINSNFSQISMASGKLSQYLKHGKPVLVNSLESLSKIVEKYKIGIVIQDPSNNFEIESAIENILTNYSFYSRNARMCFEEEFDFEKKVQPILSFVAGL